MPQLANVILTDRAATPVNHTFTPADINGGVGLTVESSGVPVGDSRFTIGLKKTADKCKPELRLTVPVVQTQTVNGISTPVVVRTAYATISFNFDATSTTQERKDLVGMMQSALDSSKTVINDVIVNLQGVF